MFDENLTTIQQEQIMNYLIKCYKQSCNRMKRYEECGGISEHPAVYQSDKTTKMLIEDALLELNEEEREIIIKCYIYVQNDLWYLDYYTKSTFYRLKAKALSKFLHCLHV